MGVGWEIFIFLTALKNRSMLEDTLNTSKLSCQTELNDIYIKYPNENQIVLGKNVGIKIHHNFSFFFNFFFYLSK